MGGLPRVLSAVRIAGRDIGAGGWWRAAAGPAAGAAAGGAGALWPAPGVSCRLARLPRGGGAPPSRLPRRPMLVIGNLAAAGTAALLAALVAAGQENPGAVVVLVTLQGSASALIMPFQQAILPDLVPRSEFLAAISLNSAQFNLGRIAGPALAGAAVAAFGYPVAFVANAVSFLAVVVALACVRLGPPAGRQMGLFASLRSGFTAARREPSCRAAIATIAVVAFLASPFIALVPVMAHHLTHGGSRAGPQPPALPTAPQGAGAGAGALCLCPLAPSLGRGRVLAWGLVLLPATLIAYSTAATRWWGAAALFAVGMVYIGVLSGLSTLVQLRAPQAYRGRVLSFFLVALGVAYPLGSLVQGPIIDRIGMGWTTAGSAVLLSLIMAGASLWWPGIRRALTNVAGDHQAGLAVDATAAGPRDGGCAGPGEPGRCRDRWRSG